MEYESNTGNSINHKTIFNGFEYFLTCFIDLKYELFLWNYNISKRKSKFYYSNNLPIILGIENSQLDKLSKGIISFIDDNERNEYQLRIENFINNKDLKYLSHKYKINKKDGTPLYFYEKIIKYVNGDKINLLAFASNISRLMMDITDISKKLENLSEQIESRDKFLSILSHDLKSPFASILGFTEILLNDNSISEKERNEFLSYIYDSANNQLQFINYLLDWSNLKLGRIKLNRQKVNISDLIYNSISNLTGNAIRKNIDIKPQIDYSIYLKVDERLALQAIMNLLSNSIKFSPEGKTIYIIAHRFNKDFAEIIIKDQGIGIPEEHWNKLFEINNFFTQKGTKGEKGTGIGLSLVKEIIEKHGGDIWFFSKENEGTEFHLTLPIVENTILVVENDKQTLQQIETMLNEQFGMFKPICCDSTYKALNICLENKPSLIMINPEHSLMNGVEFFNALNKISPNFNIPVILLLNDSSDLKNYTNFGILKFVTKPINYLNLSTMISEMVL